MYSYRVDVRFVDPEGNYTSSAYVEAPTRTEAVEQVKKRAEQERMEVRIVGAEMLGRASRGR